tara:strand:- start:5949 stop:6848 length:900 start_codon:yes stop_codon:yes gene_type:complete
MKGHPKITIAIPVYNGEKFLKKCVESILKQTRVDFELIISDNASTDGTAAICKEYEKKDERIKCIFQKKNMGAINNFKILLENAIGDYFLFVAVDNYLSPTFLEKCAETLDSNPNTVGCISKIVIDEQYTDPFKKEKKILKKLGLAFRPYDTIPILGRYEERIKKMLKEWQWEMFYSLYRTTELKKSTIWEFWTGFDAAWVLNILKYGEIRVVNEPLYHSYPSGENTKGLLYIGKTYNNSTLAKIFPFYTLTKWCLNNIGKDLFLKNIHHFFRLNMDAVFLQFVSIYQNRKNKIKNEYT